MSISSPTLYNGVRIVDRPDPENVRLVDMGALPMIREMQRTGMGLNVSHLTSLSKRLLEEMDAINEYVNDLTGYPISLGSPDQVAKLLFQDLGLPNKGIKLTDSGDREEVDADTLEGIRDLHPCIPYILEFRQRRTIKRNFADKLPRLVNRQTGRLHTHINPVRTATGRLASSDPNLQNIPIRTELGAEIRKAFVPRPGNGIGSMDASQIELRLLANERKVNAMIEVYTHPRAGLAETDPRIDLHSRSAVGVFQLDKGYEHLPFTEFCEARRDYWVDQYFLKKQRKPTKTINFLVAYDGSAPALRVQLVSVGADADFWTLEQCEKAIYNWYQQYPEVAEGFKRQELRARRYGLVWDSFGRARMIPEVRSVHKWVQSAGLRQGGNLEIQGFAAGILKLVMAEVYDEWERYWRHHGIELLVPVHDEIVCEGPMNVLEDFLHYMGAVLQNCMGGYLNVPLDYGWAISEESWGAMKE